MREATIPVDLRNPGQVFACLGLMEAAEILCGPCEGGFTYRGSETNTRFRLSVPGGEDPVERVLGFLASAKVKAVAPVGSALADKDRRIETVTKTDAAFPCPQPDSPSALPAILVDPDEQYAIPIEHWAEVPRSGRDNVKFWGGAGGYSGAALTRDALKLVAGLGANALAAACADPFNVEAPQSSSFRFDWRRSYVPVEAGFSPNNHKSSMTMVGYPFVELLAAIGLQSARPERLTKLAYRYGVSNATLPTVFVRAVLGGQSLGFPVRRFRIQLGWPGKEGQERCILDAKEETTL